MAVSSSTTPARLERREGAELFKAGIDFFTRERAEAFHAKAFAAEASHDGPVNHGSAQHAPADLIAFEAEAVLGQIADKAARETIARAGRIENIIEQIRDSDEIGIAPEEHGAELAALDHQSVRAHFQNLRGGLAQVVFTRQHARFVIVDQQEIPVLDGFEQFRAEIADPEIHGVAASQAQVLHLRADAALQAGLNVAQKQVAGILIALRKLGLKIREHVEIGGERHAIVHVVGIFAGPEESLAGYAFQAFQIDTAAGQQIGIGLREIVAHHGHDAHLREITRGEGNIRGGAAQHALHASVRRFNAVISN